MKNLKLIKTIQRVRERNGFQTLQFFDIWEWTPTKDIFNKIKSNNNVFELPYEELHSNTNLSDNVNCLSHMYIPEKLLLSNKEKNRVSMSALVLIKLGDSCLLLKERDSIKPFGGAYIFQDVPDFCSLILEYPQSKDLRFFIDFQEIPEITKWFFSKQGRELTPIRELKEELCLENDILELKEFNTINFDL